MISGGSKGNIGKKRVKRKECKSLDSNYENDVVTGFEKVKFRYAFSHYNIFSEE